MRRANSLVLAFMFLSLCFTGFCGILDDFKPVLYEDILKKAQQGDATSQFSLGLMYYKGEDVKQDYKEAIKWYTKAAEQRHPIAQLNLGLMYGMGQGVEPNYIESAKWFTKSAEQRNVNAEYFLGLTYLAKQDYKQTIKWFSKAAEQKHALAQYGLGLIYEQGLDVEQNFKEAVKWYAKAADQGLAIAQNTLGAKYCEGKGVERDYNKAISWFALAANQGLVDAQINMGTRYYKGEGIEQDYKEAFKWYKKAAEQGDAESQYYIGKMYSQGLGIEQDNKEAMKWYTKATEQGNAKAQFNLGLMYYKGEGVEQDYKEALKWYAKASEQGEASAQFNMGLMYALGQGVIEDYVEAYKWLLLAGMNGKDVAEIKEDLKKEMTPNQIALAQQKAKEFIAVREKTPAKDKEGISSIVATSGTGFFISKEGYLLTAAHVVQKVETVQVFWQGKTLVAQKVFNDKEHDLAVLKVQGTDSFPALPLLGSSEVKTGDAVFTIGFPQIQIQGAEPKYTDGSISALSGIGNNPKYFQISVPIQPGNSGGPLLDNKGRVIGIVVSRLDDVQMLLETGSVPQNVNYALKGSFVLSLLESVSDVSGKLEKQTDMNKAEAIEKAKKAVAIVICTLQ